MTYIKTSTETYSTGSGYMLMALGSNQTTGLGAGGRVEFDTIVTSSGESISLNTGNGIITLEASRSYRLEGGPDTVFSSNSGGNTMQVKWYDRTNSVEIGNLGTGRPFNAPNGRNAAAQSVAFIQTTTSSIDVELRIIASSNISNINNKTHAFIEVINQ